MVDPPHEKLLLKNQCFKDELESVDHNNVVNHYKHNLLE